MSGHSKIVVSLAYSPDGTMLASRGADAVKVWDVEHRELTSSFPQDGSEMGSLAFAPDGQSLGASVAPGGAVVWDLASKQVRRTYESPQRPQAIGCYSVTYGWGLAYSPDGKTLGVGGSHDGQDGFVTLWDVARGIEVTYGMDSSQGPVTSVAFTPDGKEVVSKEIGGSIVFRDVASGSVRDTIHASRSYATPFCLSPDGKTLASGSDDRTLKLWDVATGDPLATLKAHRKGLLGIAYHPKGRLLATSDAGGTILIWDLVKKYPVAKLNGHDGRVWTVVFSPDGKTLASGGEDRLIRLWDVSDLNKAR